MLMPIRRRAGTAGISVPVTACAIRMALSLLKIRRPGNTIGGQPMVAADTPYRADTELTSIFGMDFVTRTAPCRHSSSRADNGTTAMATTNVVRGAVTIDHDPDGSSKLEPLAQLGIRQHLDGHGIRSRITGRSPPGHSR